jgi:hypothetical protein
MAKATLQSCPFLPLSLGGRKGGRAMGSQKSRRFFGYPFSEHLFLLGYGEWESLDSYSLSLDGRGIG